MKAKHYLIMALLLMSPIAYAESQFTCLDSNSLNELAEITIDNDTLTINETRTCTHGCSNQFESCKPNPLISNTIGFGIPLLFLIIALISFRNMTIWTPMILTLLLILNSTLIFVDLFSNYVHIMGALMVFILGAGIGLSIWGLKIEEVDDDD